MSDIIHLLITEGPEEGTGLSIPPEGARVGRSQKNDLTIRDNSMSRNHCRFFFKDRRLWVADLGSSNGTFVNGVSLAEAGLRGGDVIRLGATAMKVLNDGLLTASLSSAEEEAAEQAQMNVRRRWVPAAGVAFSRSVKVLACLLLALWWAILMYSLVPRHASPASTPSEPAVSQPPPVPETPAATSPTAAEESVAPPAAEAAADTKPAAETPSAERPAIEAGTETAPAAEAGTETMPAAETPTTERPAAEAAAETNPAAETPSAEAAPAVTQTAETNAPSAEADATRLETLKTDLAKFLLAESFAEAKSRLAAEGKLRNSEAFSADLKRLSGFVERVSQINDVIAAALRARVGETITLRGKNAGSLTLVAVGGGNITGSVKTESGSRVVTLAISALSPADRSQWIGQASTPEKAAMHCILRVKAQDKELAANYAAKAGAFSEAFSRLLTPSP